MTIIQLTTLPGAVIQRLEPTEEVSFSAVARVLTRTLPNILSMNHDQLGLLHSEEEQYDVEHRTSGFSKNPADMRVLAFLREARPDDETRNKIDHKWHEILEDWFYDNGYEVPDIIDIKLVYGC